METSAYQNLKLVILDVLSLSKDAIHIHIGLLVFFLAIVLWRRGQPDILALLPVFLVAGGMEVLDLRDDLGSLGYSLSPVMAGVSWCGFVPFGWFGASGLGRQLVARPEISVFRQGPQIWRAVGSSIGRRCRFKNWCWPCGAIHAKADLDLLV